MKRRFRIKSAFVLVLRRSNYRSKLISTNAFVERVKQVCAAGNNEEVAQSILALARDDRRSGRARFSRRLRRQLTILRINGSTLKMIKNVSFVFSTPKTV